jgi:DNA-directed RNA polymerase subunit RPC12/RpoP
MLYRVHAANRETGDAKSWEIESTNVEEAERQVFEAGYLLERIEAATVPATPGEDSPIHFFCRRCGESLRAPKGVGTVDVDCPKCKLRSVLPESDLVGGTAKTIALSQPVGEIVTTATTKPAIARGALDCPACGSDLTRKLSVLYSEGTTQIDERVKIQGRVGPVRGSNLSATGKTLGSQQTDLAKIAAPPRQAGVDPPPSFVPPWFPLVGVVCFFGWIGGSICLLVETGCIGILWAVLLGFVFALLLAVTADSFQYSPPALKWKEERYERVKQDIANWREETKRWEQSFLCLRCGEKFIPGSRS